MAAAGDHGIRLWDAATGELVRQLEPSGKQSDAEFSNDSKWILNHAVDHGPVYVWDVATGEMRLTLNVHSQAHFTPDSRQVMGCPWQKHMQWTDLESRNVTRQINLLVTAYVLSPDGRSVCIYGGKSAATLLDLTTGQKLELSGHTRQIGSAAFSPDGRRILTASQDRTARLWDAVTGRQVMMLREHSGWVNKAQFSADGTSVLTVGNDGLAVLRRTQ